MTNMIRVALDAMGGDHAPKEIVKGAVDAVNKRESIHITLLGQKEEIERELACLQGNKERITVVDAPEIIEMSEAPVEAIRKKKQSSIVLGMKLVKEQKAEAFISAGNSGAILAGGQLLVGRSKGVERAPFAPLIPTETGMALLLDCGANVDARASHLVQFAKIGSIYMRDVMGIQSPRVALVNIGAEEEKGNGLTKECYPLLKACQELQFIGNIEAREIPEGKADVIVCEAFVGNVILKLYEGLSAVLLREIKKGLLCSWRSKLGAMLIKPALKKTLKGFDVTEHGGAPMLGLNGLVLKVHGNSTSKEICNSILQSETFQRKGIVEKIRKSLEENKESV